MSTDPASRLGPHLGPRLVLGLFVTAAGVLWTLVNLGYVELEEFWRWWPAVIIGLGLVRALQTSGSGRLGALLVAGVGTLLLFDQLRIWYFNFWELWPLVFVAIGLFMIWGAFTRRSGSTPPGVTSDAWITAAAVLGGSARGTNSQEFRGGEATVMLGSCEINLRHASIAEREAVLDVFAFWGGIDIRVPEDWTVLVQATPVLAGITDKTRRPAAPTKRLVIHGLAVMAGIDITN